MKIAVGSLGTSMDAWVGGRFGYCPQFIIVDTDTNEHIVVPMPQGMSEREASRRAIRIVAQNGADVLLVGKTMPACAQVIRSLGIQVIEGIHGLTVQQAIDRYLTDALTAPEGKTGQPPRLAVAALGDGLDAPVGPSFGRVERFVIVDPDTMHCSSLPVEPDVNGNHLRRETIRELVSQGVNVVLTPAISPVCCQALWSLAIEVIVIEASGTVAQAVERYKRGDLGPAQVLWPEEEAA